MRVGVEKEKQGRKRRRGGRNGNKREGFNTVWIWAGRVVLKELREEWNQWKYEREYSN